MINRRAAGACTTTPLPSTVSSEALLAGVLARCRDQDGQLRERAAARRRATLNEDVGLHALPRLRKELLPFFFQECATGRGHFHGHRRLVGHAVEPTQQRTPDRSRRSARPGARRRPRRWRSCFPSSMQLRLSSSNRLTLNSSRLVAPARTPRNRSPRYASRCRCRRIFLVWPRDVSYLKSARRVDLGLRGG